MEEMTDDGTRRRFGDDLYVAPLAIVKEPDKLRVIHDGSNKVHVNPRITVRDQIRFPGAGELRWRLPAFVCQPPPLHHPPPTTDHRPPQTGLQQIAQFVFRPKRVSIN